MAKVYFSKKSQASKLATMVASKKAKSSSSAPLSAEQEALVEWASSPTSGNAFVSADPGSGKTTTLAYIVGALHEGPENALVVAFSKEIAVELEQRMPVGATCSTIHSVAFRSVSRATGKRPNINDFVSLQQAMTAVGGPTWPRGMDDATAQEWSKNLPRARFAQKMAEWHKNTLCSAEQAWEYALAECSGDDVPSLEESAEWLRTMLNAVSGELKAREPQFTFADLIWLCAKNPAFLKPFQKRVVLVDEAQDLSPSLLACCEACVSPGGRMCLVGDKNQAIFGFAGASSDFFCALLDRLGAEEFRLSTSYRIPACDQTLDILRVLSPDIKCREGAPEGVFREIDIADIYAETREEDFVLSRLNAPLVSLCLRFWARGRKAHIRKMSIGGHILENARKWAKLAESDDHPYKNWYTRMEDWFELSKAKAENWNPQRQEAFLSRLNDERGVYQAFYDASHSLPFLLANMEDMLSGKRQEGVRLSSVHRAKGLEAERVFVIESSWRGNTLFGLQGEEARVAHVACSRHKRELIIVKGKLND